jgi:hypothetical protein
MGVSMRAIKPYTTINTMKKVYYSCFNSIMQHGLIFWGNSPQSIKIFRIQKNIIRITMGRTRRNSCRNLFKELEILSLMSQYIFSLLLFMTKNCKEFTDNTEIYEIKTRQQKKTPSTTCKFKEISEGIS